MRKSSVVIVLSASASLANQIGLLPAQQPVDPAALLDGDPNQFDTSNLRIAHDSMLDLKPSVNKDDLARSNYIAEHEARQLQDPSLHIPPVQQEHSLEQDQSETSPEGESQTRDQVYNKPEQDDLRFVPPPRHPHHARHHTHSHHGDRYAHRRQNNIRRGKAEVNTSDGWKSWQSAKNEWSVDPAARTIYPERTDLPAPLQTMTQTKTLGRAGLQADEALPLQSSASPPSPVDTDLKEKWNSGIKSHTNVETEDDLIALNLEHSKTQHQAESGLDLESVGGSYHEAALGGGSSNTRYTFQNNAGGGQRSAAFALCSSDESKTRMGFVMVGVAFVVFANFDFI